jgi:hypothetical protein
MMLSEFERHWSVLASWRPHLDRWGDQRDILMKLSFLKCCVLLILAIPASMKADIAFLSANVTSAGTGSGSSGSASGFVTISDLQDQISVGLAVSGLDGNMTGGTGIYFGDDLQSCAFCLGAPPATEGFLSGTFGINPTIAQDLLAGRYFFNVFTSPIGFQSFAATFQSLAAQDELDAILREHPEDFELPMGTLELRGQILPTPEPAAWMMLGGLFIGLAARKLRRRV